MAAPKLGERPRAITATVFTTSTAWYLFFLMNRHWQTQDIALEVQELGK